MLTEGMKIFGQCCEKKDFMQPLVKKNNDNKMSIIMIIKLLDVDKHNLIIKECYS